MTKEELTGQYQLGYALEQEGKVQAAEAKYDLVIKEAIDYPELRYKAYKAKLYLNFDNVEIRNNVSTIMVEVYSKEAGMVEDLYLDLSAFYKIAGDNDRYINYLEQLTSNFPKSKHYAHAIMELGLAYQHVKGNVGLAIKCYIDYFNKAGKKHEGVQVVALNLAECYNAIGNTSEAKNVLKKYLGIS